MTVNSLKKVLKHFCIRHNLTQGDGRNFQNGGLLIAESFSFLVWTQLFTHITSKYCVGGGNKAIDIIRFISSSLAEIHGYLFFAYKDA